MIEEKSGYAPTSDERIMGVLSHILAIVPGIGILGPLVIYLVRKGESEFVTENAKESLNFQLTVIIAYIVGFILLIVLIGALLLSIIWALNAVLVIVATIKASENKVYRYPFNLRLIR
ncbi:DUF4870 domain-containing protein [Flavitalea flava]